MFCRKIQFILPMTGEALMSSTGKSLAGKQPRILAKLAGNEQKANPINRGRPGD